MNTETKIFEKLPFWRPKRWNLDETRWTTYGVSIVDPFPIEKFHKFGWMWILVQNKISTERKIFEKKMPFRRPKQWNSAKKWWTSCGILLVDPFPIEKLHKFVWIWMPMRNKVNRKTKIFEKSHLIGRNDRNRLKNDKPSKESCSLTHFQSKSHKNLCDSKV